MAKSRKNSKVEGADGPGELSPDFLRSVGGNPLQLVSGLKSDASMPVAWMFGWIPPAFRSDKQHAADARAKAEMPKFYTPPRKKEPKQALLFELWKAPQVVEANGRPFTGIFQKTGSCVGAGGGTCWNTLSFNEAVRLGDPEIPKFIYWLLPYGRSRFYLGDRSPGEGSTGSTFAKAAREDGAVPYDTSGLPQPKEDDGMLTWGSSVEMAWSDGDAAQTMNLLPSSRKHLVKTTAQCQSANDVKAALQNGYPCTAASMYAHDGGKVQGTPPVLLGTRKGSWSHQMSIIAWMLHPQFGDLFYLMNQWGASAHGTCPTGAPRGGVWIKAADVDWICRDEVFAFSQFEGFPAPSYDIPGIFL